jgi:hypothetical protein
MAFVRLCICHKNEAGVLMRKRFLFAIMPVVIAKSYCSRGKEGQSSSAEFE